MSALASTNTEHDPDATAAALPPELQIGSVACDFGSSTSLFAWLVSINVLQYVADVFHSKNI